MCDMPSAFRERERIARKDHRCCECYGTIKAGVRYMYSSGVWDGQGSSFKTCLRCDAVRTDGSVLAGLVEFDCGPPMGGLAQWLLDAAGDLDMDLKSGHAVDIIERGGAMVMATIESREHLSHQHWRDDDRTAHPNCTTCLSQSKLGTTFAAIRKEAESDALPPGRA